MKISRSVLSFVLSAMLALLLTPMIAWAAPEEAGDADLGGDSTEEVVAAEEVAPLALGSELSPLAASYFAATEADLLAAISAALAGDPTTITLTANITLTATVSIPGGKVIILDGSYSLTGAAGSATIRVENGGQLTIDGITVTHIAGEIGRGIDVAINGTLIMSSGAISGNTASGSSTSGYGGGVYANSNSVFTMTGGTISDNKASNEGGGIYIVGATFNMSGTALITNNTSSGYGGGVYQSSGTSVMSGGTISNNTAAIHGGGVDVVNGTFTMSGGTNSGNNSPIGGGVYLHNYANLFVGSSAVFANNKANGASPNYDMSLDTTYQANIDCTNWTSPFTQGYNNYDISHAITHYEVAFNGNGGTVAPENAMRFAPLSTGLGADMPPDPVWDGYAFTGWNTQSDGTGTAFTSSSVIMDTNITVYAQWDVVLDVLPDQVLPATGDNLIPLLLTLCLLMVGTGFIIKTHARPRGLRKSEE